MSSHVKYVDVIIPVPVYKLFTYSIPDEYKEKIKPGIRVTVQFGAKKIYAALAYKIHNKKPIEYDTKEVISVIDTEPVVNQRQLEFWEWIFLYYMASLGEIFKAGLPSGLKLESETKIFFNSDFVAEEKLSQGEEQILNFLEKKNYALINELNKIISIKNIHKDLKLLISKGAVFSEEVLKKRYKTKTEVYVILEKDYQEEKKLNLLIENLNKAPKQLSLLMGYLDLIEFVDTNQLVEIKRKDLLDYSNTTIQVFNSLVKKNVFKVCIKEILRGVTVAKTKEFSGLNIFQDKAFMEIKDQFLKKDVVLLHGVTSSGKTEIYIHLIKEQLEQGKQVLYLLPEIALTAQIINRLRNVFGDKVGTYHSKFNDSERVETYNRILSFKKENKNNIQLILGVRSSVFLPFSDLGLIIIDEEHENTYKQFDPAPRYHARDSGIYLAKLHNAKVLLGTATPSLESYYNSKSGKYGLVELKERYKEVELPEIIIANTREAYKKKQMKSLFTPILLDNIKDAFNNGEQTILFQNRRGYSPFLECFSCGWVPYCIHCDVSLTYHKNHGQLICHYCGYSVNVPHVCEACGSPDLKTKGFGTEKIEDEISIFFPDARIARMDLDSTRSRKSYERIISDFEQNNIDILIGTQMISKGMDFNNVSTVGIMNADNMLNFPDFRAFERSYQLMAQVSGRAGRRKKRGKVIIQTSNPDHTIIMDVLSNNYKSMFFKQLEERKEYKYPPFYRLILIKVLCKDREKLNEATMECFSQLHKIFGDRLIGPEFPLISRIQNWFQKNILLKLEQEKSHTKAKDYIISIINYVLSRREYKSVRIVVDVDPM